MILSLTQNKGNFFVIIITACTIILNILMVDARINYDFLLADNTSTTSSCYKSCNIASTVPALKTCALAQVIPLKELRAYLK